MAGLTIASIAFESVGLVLAFIGFNMTLSRTSPGRSLVPLVVRRSATYLRQWAAAALAKLTRKGRSVNIQMSGSAAGMFMTGGSAVVYTSLTSVVHDPQAFMEELETKLKTMMNETAKVASHVDLVEKGANHRADKIAEDVEARFTRLAEEEQRKTEHDLVLQFWGWSIVVIGLILGAVSSVI